MSQDYKQVYYHHLFHDDQSSDINSPDDHPHLQMFDPNSYLSFTEILHGPVVDDGNNNTPNSSTSAEDTTKKEIRVKPTKKKGETKEKQARFAFMTKSEVDHLEDGYRWRKYGQKAVKNSPYPRSYYRCTTQKCTVKKRVERSFQDPRVVITTYEGQHNHHVPANLRGQVAAGMYGHSMLHEAASFPQELLLQMPQLYGYDHGCTGPNNFVYQQQRSSVNPHPHHYQQFADYGILQDIIHHD